jgi:hypothetical protein
MKNSIQLILLTLILVLSNLATMSQTTPNRMSVVIDGKLYNTQPRKIKFGNATWVTGNSISPDKSLRIWIANWQNPDSYLPGKYMICDIDKKLPKDEELKLISENYVGLAYITYVEETKAPRMAYHKGISAYNQEILTVSVVADSTIFEFNNVKLTGSKWKEKASATVLGGLGRLEDKMMSKGKTKATGFDDDIDPEYNGYKKLPESDIIVLTNGRVALFNK